MELTREEIQTAVRALKNRMSVLNERQFIDHPGIEGLWDDAYKLCKKLEDELDRTGKKIHLCDYERGYMQAQADMRHKTVRQ